MKSAIQTELLEKLGDKAKRKEGEAGPAHRLRLAKLANKLEDKEWEKLSEGTQEWLNAATKAYQKDSEVPAFPDAKGEDAEAKDADEKPAKKSKKDDSDGEDKAKDDDDEKPAKKSKKDDSDGDEKPAKKSNKRIKDDDA